MIYYTIKLFCILYINCVPIQKLAKLIIPRFGLSCILLCYSCEVIRDKKTGNSLQYAFVEFDNQKSCEDAYLKMDNVLIDDRRIHVDFSQSVSKIKWLGKGRGVKYTDKDDEGKNISDKYSKYRNKKRDSYDSRNNYIKNKVSIHESKRYKKDDNNYKYRESEKEERTSYSKYKRNEKDNYRRHENDDKTRKNYRNEGERRNEKDRKNEKGDKYNRSNRDDKDKRSDRGDRTKRTDKHDRDSRR